MLETDIRELNEKIQKESQFIDMIKLETTSSMGEPRKIIRSFNKRE